MQCVVCSIQYLVCSIPVNAALFSVVPANKEELREGGQQLLRQHLQEGGSLPAARQAAGDEHLPGGEHLLEGEVREGAILAKKWNQIVS